MTSDELKRARELVDADCCECDWGPGCTIDDPSCRQMGRSHFLRALADEVERLQREVSATRERMGRQIEDLTKGRHWQLEREREEVWKPLLAATRAGHGLHLGYDQEPGDCALCDAITRAEKAVK